MTDQNADKMILPAATVILLRDRPGGYEVLMVQRNPQVAFAANALVFPGGRVDDADRSYALRSESDPDDELVAKIASIRECFEEARILLARQSDQKQDFVDPVVLQKMDQTANIYPQLEAQNLKLAPDALTPFARWIAPKFAPKRFDTWFFLAQAPEDHLAIHDGLESIASTWIRPKDAIQAAYNGIHAIIFPTLMNLLRLAEYDKTQDLITAAHKIPPQPIEPFMETRNDVSHICIRSDAGYPINSMPAKGVLRG